ncbi:MAG: carbohydrate porin [Reyranella sp.]|nr:carbohydrate porin [Reyranella sp.]
MRRMAGSVVLAALAVVTTRAEAQTYDPQGQRLVGRIHDANRAARKRQELSLSEEVDSAHVRYARTKKEIENATGIAYSMETSFMSQWGTPNGGYGAVQAMFTPSVNWDAFSSPSIGNGSVQFRFLSAQYLSGASGTSLGSNINLISPINNQPDANNQFVQLTYTQAFPGDWLAISVGQYAFSNFDGNAYANDQQVNFIGFSLTQNGSQNYSQAGIGAYAQVNPTKEITFAAGFQDANDFSGSYVQFPTVAQGQYAWFGYAAWSPALREWGQGNYALLYYNQPGVSLQPLASSGLSFSASQPIGDRVGLFVRANTAWQSSFAIQSSIAGGFVLNDPVKHSRHDQIGLAMAWNATNMSLFTGTFVRPSETMVEAYWSWSVFRGFLVTPDVQLYLQPALAPGSDLAAVFTIRVTQLF